MMAPTAWRPSGRNPSLQSNPSACIAFTISNATGKLSIVAARCDMGVLLLWAWQPQLEYPFLPLTQNLLRHRGRLRMLRATRRRDQVTVLLEKLRARLLANPKVKAEYDALVPEFEVAAELIRARRAGLSEAQLAARMGTHQSTIARLESGQALPEHEDAVAVCRGDGEQVPCAAVGGMSWTLHRE